MRCPVCKSEMIWQSDWDLEDDDVRGIATHYVCSYERCESEFIHIQKEEEGSADE